MDILASSGYEPAEHRETVDEIVNEALPAYRSVLGDIDTYAEVERRHREKSDPKSEYSRQKLIALIDASVVSHDKWSNRDTPTAQAQAATARAYLLAGCDFRLSQDSELLTTESTIWLEIKHYEFEDEPDWHQYYLPTTTRIEAAAGGDWYG
jgi:hypothetical protein